MSTWYSAGSVRKRTRAHYTCMNCYLTQTACVCPTRGEISGAITSQYLLEKSRIVFQVRRTHLHTHTMAGQVGVFLPLSHGEKKENVRPRCMKCVTGIPFIFILHIMVCTSWSAHLHIWFIYHPWIYSATVSQVSILMLLWQIKACMMCIIQSTCYVCIQTWYSIS